MRSILFFALLFSFQAFTPKASGQSVWEDHRGEVYNYLSRMAQKGFIVFNDHIRPLSRIYIEQCLDSLAAHQTQLSRVEQKELDFYRQEYTDSKELQRDSSAIDTKPTVFKKDGYARWRFFSYTGKQFLLRADPVITAGYIRGSGKDVKQYSSGFNIYGYGGKHWSWYIALNDINEKGPGMDTTRQNTPETGIVGRIADNKKSHNYTAIRAGLAYTWKNGSVSIGQDHLLWGYGENGRMVLSDKAPTYPYIRLDYRPLPWLSFNYTHAWLHSDIRDSTRSYRTGNTVYGGIREFTIAKYMATHSVQITPTKGLDISLGESMIYSDRLELGYLIPIMFFKAYDNLVNDNNNNNGSNGQFFFQVSSRNQLPKTHLYSTLFIDEILLSKVFDKVKNRNQVGMNIGASVTDAFIPYLTIGAEYTKIRPFVYSNLIPAQLYTHDSYLLGDWMGNNADRWIAFLKYTPAPRLQCMVRYQYIRKGGPGTVDQQYFAQPQPPFLFDLQNHRQEWYGSLSYQWVHKLYLRGFISNLHVTDYKTGQSYNDHTLNIGMSYGL